MNLHFSLSYERRVLTKQNFFDVRNVLKPYIMFLHFHLDKLRDSMTAEQDYEVILESEDGSADVQSKQTLI